MKIRKDLDLCIDDFWYDLTQGGYIDPKKLCTNDEDIKKVNDAINVLSDFEKSVMNVYGN